MNILGVILARGGSKRIPKKNLQLLNGKTLIEITIDQALRSKYINEVVVSTDDNTIKSISENSGALVVDRPIEYTEDKTVNEADNIIIDLIEKFESKKKYYDICVLLYPTAPLRTIKDIDKTIEKILNEDCDCALTLVKDQCYIWQTDLNGNYLTPVNYNPKKRTPSTEHEFLQYRENKAVYAFKKELLINSGSRIGGKIGYITMNNLNSIDIDNPEDLELTKILINFNSQEKM